MAQPLATSKQELSRIVAEIGNTDVDRLESDFAARDQLLTISRKLTAALEGPVNRATDLVFKPYMSIAARLAVDLDLFHRISANAGPITSKELARFAQADWALISRVLRLLASADFVIETAEDEWKANDTTRAMASPAIAAGHRFVYDALITSAIKAPKFLRETKYKVPTEPTDTFLQYANQTKLPFFEFLQSIPPLLSDFNLFMGSTMGAREYWHEWYDIQGRLLYGFSASKSPTLLVDVGGGKGHDLNAFNAAFQRDPNSYKGNLVLQDLPHVLGTIADTELAPGISKMSHDFFEEQPVKGARAYFLHHVLHDWSDKYCRIILQQLRKAFVPGYSKLLIHELILPNTGAAEIQGRFDLVMMTLGGGMERSKHQWSQLLEDAGFCKITFHEHFDHDGIIEAEAS